MTYLMSSSSPAFKFKSPAFNLSRNSSKYLPIVKIHLHSQFKNCQLYPLLKSMENKTCLKQATNELITYSIFISRVPILKLHDTLSAVILRPQSLAVSVLCSISFVRSLFPFVLWTGP